MRIRLLFSTACHTLINGQMEVTNRIVNFVLKGIVNKTQGIGIPTFPELNFLATKLLYMPPLTLLLKFAIASTPLLVLTLFLYAKSSKLAFELSLKPRKQRSCMSK